MSNEAKVLRRVVIATNDPTCALELDNLDIMRIRMREKNKDEKMTKVFSNRKEFMLYIVHDFLQRNKKWLD